MAFTRATGQSRNTLRGHYEELAACDDEGGAAQGRMMLQLIARLEEAFRDQPVWGVTSIYHLKLLPADDPASPWFVSISPPSPEGCFHIDFLMPEATAPWPEARVRGEAHGVQAAVEMILRAMKESGAWKHA